MIQYFCVIALFCASIFWLIAGEGRQWEAVWTYRQFFFHGWLATIALSLSSLGLSLVIGTIAALIQRSKFVFCRLLIVFYIDVIRGTPLLVQILFFFYVIAHQIGLENRYVAGIIILSLFHGAYIAEMIRSGLDSISTTQRMSARAIGLTNFQSYRFVIFPQAVRLVIPPLAGQFASIIKDSSLLSIIGINEVTNTAQQINSATYSTLESFLPLAVAYLILTLPISLLSKQLERKFYYDN
jgi:polar amino acid transport system permease protein